MDICRAHLTILKQLIKILVEGDEHEDWEGQQLSDRPPNMFLNNKTIGASDYPEWTPWKGEDGEDWIKIGCSFGMGAEGSSIYATHS